MHSREVLVSKKSNFGNMSNCDDQKSRYCGEITAVLFDLDNTLIATRQIDESTCDEVCNWLCKQSIPPNDCSQICQKYLRSYRAAPAPVDGGPEELLQWRKDIWAKVLDLFGHKVLTDEVFELWHHTRLSKLRLSNAIKELITKIKSSYKVGVISNGYSAAQWEKINACNLKDLIPDIIVSGDIKVAKPNAEFYSRIFATLKVTPNECMVVGDRMDTDILGGVNAGVGVTVLVAPLHYPLNGKTTIMAPRVCPAQRPSFSGVIDQQTLLRNRDEISEGDKNKDKKREDNKSEKHIISCEEANLNSNTKSECINGTESSCNAVPVKECDSFIKPISCGSGDKPSLPMFWNINSNGCNMAVFGVYDEDSNHFPASQVQNNHSQFSKVECDEKIGKVQPDFSFNSVLELLDILPHYRGSICH